MRDLLLKTGFWIPWLIANYLAFAPRPPAAVARISDVVLHVFAFTYLTAALLFAYYRPAARPRWHACVWMLAWGVAVECIQYFIPERSFQLKDLAIDVVGIGLGLGLFALVPASLREAVRSRG